MNDVQIGAHGVAETEFREHIEELIADPDAHLIGIGDYCVVPETRVLTADLRWVPAGELQAGDEIVGFDDERERGQRRRFRFGVITKAGRRTLPVFALHLSDGTTLTATGNHRWIATISGKTEFDWVRTDEIARRIDAGLVPTSLIRLLPMQAPIDTYQAGFLSAAFDGEGFFGGLTNGGCRISFSQRENGMMARVREYLDELGFAHSSRPATSPNVSDLRLVGGTPTLLRFMQAVRPPRLLAKWRDNNLLEQLTLRRQAALPSPTVVGYEFLGAREVAALTSSTGTYVAEGFGSHNTDGVSPSNRKLLNTAFVRGELYDTAADMLDEAAFNQAHRFLDLVDGTEGRWDYLLGGHHVWTFKDVATYGYPTTDHYIADRLGAPYLGQTGGQIESAVVTYRFPAPKGKPRPEFRVYAVHGQGGGSTWAGPFNQLERMTRGFVADLYLVAHHHRLGAVASVKLEENPRASTRLSATDSRLVACGSWLRGYLPGEVTYAEDGLMVPLALGAPVIEVRPGTSRRWKVRVTV